MAEALGAEIVEGPPQGSYGEFPITVDASGVHAGLHAALRSTEPGGVCTSIGIYYELLTPVPLLEMYTTGVTLVTGRAMARATMPAVLERIAAGDLHPDRVTSNVVAWEQAAEAVGGGSDQAGHRALAVRSAEAHVRLALARRARSSCGCRCPPRGAPAL